MAKRMKLTVDMQARTINGTDADGRTVDTTFDSWLGGRTRDDLMAEYRAIQTKVQVMAGGGGSGDGAASNPENHVGYYTSEPGGGKWPYPAAQIKAAIQMLLIIKAELGITGEDPAPRTHRLFIW